MPMAGLQGPAGAPAPHTSGRRAVAMFLREVESSQRDTCVRGMGEGWSQAEMGEAAVWGYGERPESSVRGLVGCAGQVMHTQMPPGPRQVASICEAGRL